VIHRDLKLSNVAVTPDGQPHVLDFGLARAVAATAGDGTALTQEGQWAGTPAFMSPERAGGHADQTDVRTDVYGLGATLCVPRAGAGRLAPRAGRGRCRRCGRGLSGWAVRRGPVPRPQRSAPVRPAARQAAAPPGRRRPPNVGGVAFSPDSRHVATTARAPSEVIVWGTGTGRRAGGGRLPDVRHAIAFGRDGATLIAAGGTSALRVDFRSQVVTTLAASDRGVRSAAEVPDGRHLVTGGDEGGFRVWDLQAGRNLRVGYNMTFPQDLAFSAAGGLLLAADVGPWGHVQLFDLDYPAAVRAHRAALAGYAGLQPGDPDPPELLRTLGRWYARRGVWD
jgi:hypothetical protein